jgi:hypothetical protein
MEFDDTLNDLLWAAGRGDPVECRRILEENHEFPGFLKQCTPALIRAIHYSDKDDFDIPHNDSEDWIHVTKHLRCLQIFLSYGVPIESEDQAPGTAIGFAVHTAPSDAYLHLLLDDPQDIDIDAKVDGKSALDHALDMLDGRYRERAKDQILALMRHGADIHTVDNVGNSLLHKASSYDPWILHILYLNKIDFNRRCQSNMTPLHALIYRERQWCLQHYPRTHVNTVELFMEYGADVHLQDSYGRNAIQLAEAFLPPGNLVLELLQKTEIMLTFAMGIGDRNPENCLVGQLPYEMMHKIAWPE